MITGFKKWIQYILFDKKTTISYNPELLNSISDLLLQAKRYRHDPSLPLKDTTFVIFDTETTGFHPYAGDELLSIGAVLIKNGEIYEEKVFHEWINPYRAVPPQVAEITKVKEEDLQDAPPALVVIHKFLQYMEGHYLVAHCADFDLNFINIQLKRYVRSKLTNPTIDTMTLSYHLHPSQKLHNLDYLLDLYHVPIKNRHHALGDAKMTAELFLKFIDRLERRGITTMRGLDNYIKSMHILHNHSSL